ncbi:hypothetical protein HYV86_03580 [Candidatus Woesearchaeota archaeon]|nr:hypothetical protein [Candidatus Woesearchaeota archaeon]
MVISYTRILADALTKIQLEKYQQFIVHPDEVVRDLSNTDEIIWKYGEVKWDIVELLNARYATHYDLYNWINENPADEVAYFLNEAGSNTLSYSDYKAPFRFHLWFGAKGFIIGIEQKGKGFDARRVDEKRLKENEGAAFDFFRNCQGEVFFDDAKEARVVYFMVRVG